MRGNFVIEFRSDSLFYWLRTEVFKFEQSFSIGLHEQDFIAVKINFKRIGVNDGFVLSTRDDNFGFRFCHFDAVWTWKSISFVGIL